MNISNVNNSGMSSPYSQKSAVSLSTETDAVVNPYNSKPDGFIIRALLGSCSGATMKPIIFDGAPPKVPSINGREISVGSLSSSVPGSILVQTGTNMAGTGIVYGLLSLAKQLSAVDQGKQDKAGAMANITTDVMRGSAVALGGSIGGALSGFAFRAMGVAGGAMGTIGALIGGMIGSVISSSLFEATGIREALVKKFGSKMA